jgi:hypothetical protein
MESTKKRWRWLGVAGALFVPAVAVAAVTLPFTFTPGTPVRASEVNANFAALKEAVDVLQAQGPDYLSAGPAAGTRPSAGTADITTYVSSGTGFPGQNVVSLVTGARTGTYRVSYSVRYRVVVGTNGLAFRVADTTAGAAGVALSEMTEHIHSANIQVPDRLHASGWFTIVLNGVSKTLTLQVRAPDGLAASIGVDDARLDMWKVQ